MQAKQQSIKGIRLRKGNIQIGDGQTLNAVFKDARFNGWSIGEVFISSTQLIPNARRDNLEKTPAYFTLTEQLQKVATEITREIRAASLRRNRELSEALDKAKVSAQTAVDAIGNGINATDKNRISSDHSQREREGLYVRATGCVGEWRSGFESVGCVFPCAQNNHCSKKWRNCWFWGHG